MSEDISIGTPKDVEELTFNSQEGSPSTELDEPKVEIVNGDADEISKNIISGAEQSERSDPIPDTTQEKDEELSVRENDDNLEQEIQPTNEAIEAKINEVRAKIRAATGRVHELTKAANPNLVVSHEELLATMDLTTEFYSGKKEVTDYLHSEVSTLTAELKQSVPGFVGVFAMGYPYYVLDTEGTPVATDEIPRFLRTISDVITRDKSVNPEGWLCPACQVANELPDLKSQCKPCELVQIKPRQIFHALPDLDIMMVVDNPSTETESLVNDTINRMGYSQSDHDIQGAIDRTRNVMDSIKKGETPTKKIPIDVHIISRDDFNVTFDTIATGELNVGVPVRSLHAHWEDNDIVGMGKHTVFSLTPVGEIDDNARAKFEAARKGLKAMGSDSLVENIQKGSPRFERLLKTPEVERVLRERLDKW